MVLARLDDLLRSFASSLSRRVTLAALASSVFGAGSLALVDDAKAKKKHKHKEKKKKPCAKAGQTTSKKRKQCCQGLVKDGSGICAQPPQPQPVSDCVPTTCAPNACGSVPDGCGGTLSCGGCEGESLCDAGVCQPCAVTCPSGSVPAVCGADLQSALADAGEGATVYVCPGRYLGNFTLDTAVRVIGAGDGPTSRPGPLVEPLSHREQEVLKLIAAGLTNREIAEKLFISPETVKKHSVNIFAKLSASTRTEAAARAQLLHLLD